MPKYKENCYEVSKEQAKYMSSIDTQKTDRFMLELQRIPSEAVNIENRVEACEAIRTVVERVDFLRAETERRAATSSNRIYENLAYFQNGDHSFKFDLELDNKTLILNKFFRSTERNYAAYENLCNGCGYGVFEARGHLCNFCQYVVHGAYEQLHVGDSEKDHQSNGNIYENVCEKCGTIYSSEECECQSVDDHKESIPKSSPSIDESLETTELLKKVCIKKKRSRKSLLYGLIGSLRRAKNSLTPPQTPDQSSPRTPKRLEIVHNVDGYENVFRTQESFDLEKICELKRNQNSCSDQHIYGRLKPRTLTATESFTIPINLSQSHDQLGQERWPSIEAPPKQVASADCINAVEKVEKFGKKSNNGKRPRLSKARLLRSISQRKERKKSVISKNAVNAPSAPEKQALYLADNVCQWMTSLRREIHAYQSFGLADDIASCDPKSIPARNTLTYGQKFTTAAVKHDASALALTNGENIKGEEKERAFCEITKVSEDDKNSIDDPCNWNGIVTLRRSANDLQRSPVARSRSQQMVQDFKRNLMSQQREAIASTSPTSTITTSTSTATSTPTPPSTMKTSPNNAEQRAKRQAIYLKLDDTPSNSKIEFTKNNNNSNHNNNNTIRSDAKVNYPSKQLVAEAASKLANDRGLASRCLALQPITASNKRCGIYERDSEFVNDILSVFEQFLQRETDIQSGDNTTLPTEVVSKCELNDDQSNLSAGETSTTCVDPMILNSEVTDSGGVIIVEGDRVADLCDQEASIVNDVSSDFQTEFDLNALNKHRDVVVADHCHIVQPFAAYAQSGLNRKDHSAFEQIFNASELIDYLLLSRCLNKVVIYYDKQLSAFLHCVRDRVEYRVKYSGWTAERLVRKFQRFANSCKAASPYAAIAPQSQWTTGVGIPSKLKPVCESVEQDADLASNASRATVKSENRRLDCIKAKLNEINSVEVKEECSECKTNSNEETIDAITENQKSMNSECHNVKNFECVQIVSDRLECQSVENENNLMQDQTKAIVEVSDSEKSQIYSIKPTKPPVPQRDPNTCITHRVGNSPPRPLKRASPIARRKFNKMTVPTPSRNGSSIDASVKDSQRNSPSNSIPEVEEDIYQPIWKFKTVGEVQERYHTDADYYEFDNGSEFATKQPHGDSSIINQNPMILINNDVEDHSEWETDDEFMFTTQLEDGCQVESADSQSLSSSTVRSTRSGSSITGSTVTGFGSSTMTIASAVSSSLMHHVFRNIGIFYSLSEPKLRAIIYDYDRVFATSYFAKRHALTPASSGLVKPANNESEAMQESSPIPPPRTTSVLKSRALSNSPKTKRSFPGGESNCGGNNSNGRGPTKMQLLPDSVQAWKFMLLDVNYLEDEEDMIVSETEILRAQEPKDDLDAKQNHQLHFLQRFKSASIGNLIDIPTEEDKKSITERMRNKLQRGVFKLNVRSPKSEKKSRGGLFRRGEATSLYLEDGMKPKYPIFGAPLDQLELNQTTQPNVPRFVADSVEYIERKDFITQDGLYRASGNKVSVDELKQKLSESYIYDPKLLVCDDIHTLTSLLKQFFRELGAPLIPQETYERLGRNLTDDTAIETMRIAFDEMREPNRSTLKFLIKHLTNVASFSTDNRMPASNLAIVWGPCILSANQIEYDIARMNTLAKVLIENHDRIFKNNENERMV